SATLKELISQTMVRWSQEDQIQDPELVRIMYTLLRRQYDSIGELLQALRKAYTISAASVKDTINLLAALGQIRSLLSVRMGKEEELLMINGLGYGITILVLQKVSSVALGNPRLLALPLLCNSCKELPFFLLFPCKKCGFFVKAAKTYLCSQAERVTVITPGSACDSIPSFVPDAEPVTLLQILGGAVLSGFPSPGSCVVTYLAGCGLQSCPVLLAKGYPDIGWNPIEGERYLSFLRFAVFVNSEYCSLAARSHPKLPCS
ncbi:RYR3 protein, partial [Semnornis frantzii]|nr:RYR3 protein [Semnornis frantzii]